MIFLFDRCLAERLARIIAAYEVNHKVRFLDDHFDKATKDVDWIKAVSIWDEPPVVISADNRMRRDPVERQALATSKLTLVFIKAGFHNFSMHDQALKLLKIWPEIVTETKRVVEPTAFEITPRFARVDLVCKTAKLAN